MFKDSNVSLGLWSLGKKQFLEKTRFSFYWLMGNMLRDSVTSDKIAGYSCRLIYMDMTSPLEKLPSVIGGDLLKNKAARHCWKHSLFLCSLVTYSSHFLEDTWVFSHVTDLPLLLVNIRYGPQIPSRTFILGSNFSVLFLCYLNYLKAWHLKTRES